MRNRRHLTAVLVLTGALSFIPGAVMASGQGWNGYGTSKTGAGVSKQKAEMRSVRGEVTAVEPNSRTIVVMAMEGKSTMDVGVDVTNETAIREKQAGKTLDDIKVGDRVAMTYEKTNSGLTADSIQILRPASMAAKDKGN